MSKIKTKVLHIIEWIFTILGLIMALAMLTYSAEGKKCGIILLVSALVISPFFEKIPLMQNNFKKETLIQFICSFVLFCVAVYFAPATKTSENKLSDSVVSNTTLPTTITTSAITTNNVITTTSTTETLKLTTTSSLATKKITSTTRQTTTTTITTTTTTVMTTTQNNKEKALNVAIDCVKDDAYSYSWLLETLELIGYSHDEATYAVDNCGADWNKEAVERTEIILSIGEFSQEYVTGILLDEGFTSEQSEYAVSQFDLKSENEPVVVPTVEEVQQEPGVLHFILNSGTNCIHIDRYCSAAQKISSENYLEIDIPESDLENYNGTYWACGKCSGRYADILPKF